MAENGKISVRELFNTGERKLSIWKSFIAFYNYVYCHFCYIFGTSIFTVSVTFVI